MVRNTGCIGFMTDGTHLWTWADIKGEMDALLAEADGALWVTTPKGVLWVETAR